MVRSVTVTPASATLVPGDTVRLHYAAPSGSCENPVVVTAAVWSSSNPLIAIVDPDSGLVRGIGRGNVTITAADKSDPTVRGAALITVAAPLVLAPASVAANVGDAITFAASSDSTTGPILWSSSDTNVVSIDANGVARARANGQAVVVATASKNPRVKGTAAFFVGGNGNATTAELAKTNGGALVFPNTGYLMHVNFRPTNSTAIVTSATMWVRVKSP